MYTTNRSNKRVRSTENMNRKSRLFARVLIGFLPMVVLIVGGGCALFSKQQEQPAPVVVLPIFPPQEVMQNGDYAGFLRVNEAALAECKNDDQCAIAIFNIAFVHAYPPSPYYKLSIGLNYFNDLIKKYPQSPWAIQAKAWSVFMKKSISSEKSQNQLKTKIKSKEAAINDLNKQIEQSKEVDLEIDKREKELEKLIERSRQIDIEMDRKERELLR